VARNKAQDSDYVRPLRRILVGGLVVVLLALFALWRIDNPRAERLRAAIIDQIVPNFSWAMVPVTRGLRMLEDFRSYAKLYERNQELRRELAAMKSWREAALRLEQENARLLDLNKVRLSPKLTYVTGVVIADSGSPFRRSVLLNVGRRDGIRDGWATVDGLGLVGRISGVGTTTSRVLLLTDAESRIPVVIRPSGQHALVNGDNSAAPTVDFVENPDELRPGDRVVTTGDGGVFPPGLLIGEIARGRDRRLRVRLAADYGRLEYLRVLRSDRVESPAQSGKLVAPRPVRAEGGGGGNVIIGGASGG